MRRRKINNRYLSESIPRDDSVGSVNANDFVNALYALANEHLRGALEIEIIGNAEGYTSISLSHAAYLLRVMLECTEESEVLHIKAELTDEIRLFASFRSQPDNEDLTRIISIAKVAGFSASRVGNELIFSAAIDSAALIKIYALTKDDIGKCIFEMLFL